MIRGSMRLSMRLRHPVPASASPGDHIIRRYVCGLALLLLGTATGPTPGCAQAEVPPRDRVRLAEAMRLADKLGDDIWPGWRRTPFPVLLVTDSVEFLIGHSTPSADFARQGYDSLLAREVWTRPRQFPPTLLATFPAVGGKPTIVIGSAERTGKSSTAWVLTLLHEHFHQWQSTRPGYYAGVAGLDLAHGDSTGQWMLDYAFPYDSAPVQRAVRRLAVALGEALDATPGDRSGALEQVVSARDRLRGLLTAADYRYFEFQLWQEGVARFIEYAAARAAAGESGKPAAEFRRLADYEPYSALAAEARRSLRRELEQMGLGRERRIAFYPIGAAMALLLEETRPRWRAAYEARPFELAGLLSATR
jgi:hypothetical protein